MLGHRTIRLIAQGLILVSLLAAAPVLWNRHVRESASKSVDLVLDLPAMERLARQDGLSLEDVLAEMAAAGATSLAIPEMNAEELAEHGLAVVRTGAELRAELVLTAEPNPFFVRLIADPAFSEADTYLLPVDDAVAARLWRDIQLRHPEERVDFFAPLPGEPGAGAIALRYDDEQLEAYGVGFDPADFALADGAGLRPLPRPRPAPGVTPESIREIFADLDRMSPEIRGVMFFGRIALGWRPDRTDALAQTAEELKKRGWVPHLIEHANQLAYIDQKGSLYVADALGYQIGRAFSMGQEWQDKVQPYEAVDMWWRSVLERNIRSLYVRPFLAKQDPGLTATETTARYIARTVEELNARGFTTGTPGLFAPYEVPFILKVLIGLGVVGATILWLACVLPLDPRFLGALMAVGAVGQAGMLFVAPNLGTIVLGIALATLFPTLAAAWLLLRWGLGAGSPEPRVAVPARPAPGWIVREAVVVSAAFFAINLVGGLLIAGLMGDIRHMLEFEYFRGVKLVFLAPLLLAVLTYLLLGRKGSVADVVRSLARDGVDLVGTAVKYRELLLLGVLGLAGLYYIQRSGNFPTVPVSQLELDIRAALERLLLARPRTKEFLIAYPAMVAAAAFMTAGLRRYVPLLVVAAVTGGVSIINSFEHLRTPVALSLLRGFNGLWVGLVIGLVVLVGLAALRAVLTWLFPDRQAAR